MKHITKILLLVFLLMLLLFLGPNILIKQSVKSELYHASSEIPHNRVGLLLGTSKYISKGTINLYYQYRIDAAVALFEHKKIDFILISGDNGQIEYNEPKTIRNDLIAAGIPSECIFLDYAGFRTWDSIIRAKKVFGETNLTVISQQFHNERAIYIGKFNGMKIIGYNAQDVPKKYGKKTMIRELFARIKLVIDIAVDKQPKYLGQTINIE